MNRLRYLARILVLLLVILCLHSGVKADASVGPVTIQEARQWCDTTAITGFTGLYVWPDRGAVVLLRPTSEARSGRYLVVSIEHPDINVAPGTVLGILIPTASGTDYTLEEYGRSGEGLKLRTRKYSVKADMQNGELHISGTRLTATVRPLSLIPGIRSFISVRRDNPASRQNHGMTRIYPLNLQHHKEGIDWPKYF